MEKTWYAPLTPSWGHPIFSESTSCQAIEILQYEGKPEPYIYEKKLDDSALVDWLEVDFSKPSQSGRILKSGFRLLIARYTWSDRNQLTISNESALLIEQYFDLHENFWSLFKSELSYVSQYYTIHSSKRSAPDLCRLFFKIAHSYLNHFQLSLQYSPSSKLTTVFLIISDTFQQPKHIFDHLKAQAAFHTQPLLLPILITEFFVNTESNWVSSINQEVEEVAVATGQQETMGIEMGILEEADFTETTKRLNLRGAKVATNFHEIKMIKDALEKLKVWDEAINQKKELSKDENESTKRYMILDKLSYVRDTCDSLLLMLDFNQSRIQLLLRVIYQFIAQKDARVNISIAKATKADSEIMKFIALQTRQDSAAMKTISVLGIFFLPGTFVAALFSMPVWNYQDSGGIKNGWKIYWAVTVPLTILVFLGWVVAVSAPWRKIWERMGWKRGLLGPNVDSVVLKLENEKIDVGKEARV